MKRTLVTVAVIMMMAVMTLGVGATSLSDSLRIGRETYEMLGSIEGETVIRFYRGNFLGGFAAGESISALTGDDFVSDQIYMTRSRRGSDTYHTICDGKTEEIGEVDINGGYIYDVVSKPERIFAKNIKVDNVWCFDEESDGGIYIYFVTDRGDYVYYKESEKETDEYLFPADKFTEFAKTTLTPGNGVTFDITPYLIINEEVDVLMIAAAVIAGAGTLALAGCTVLQRRW